MLSKIDVICLQPTVISHFFSFTSGPPHKNPIFPQELDGLVFPSAVAHFFVSTEVCFKSTDIKNEQCVGQHAVLPTGAVHYELPLFLYPLAQPNLSLI